MGRHSIKSLVAAISLAAATATAANASIVDWSTVQDQAQDFDFAPTYKRYDLNDPLQDPITTAFNVKAFDPALGTLQGVDFSYWIDVFVRPTRPTATFDDLREAANAGISLSEGVWVSSSIKLNGQTLSTSRATGPFEQVYLWEDSNAWYETADRFGSGGGSAFTTTGLDRFLSDTTIQIDSGAAYKLVNLPKLPIEKIDVTTNARLSLIYLYTPAVPEPASWAMMIGGVAVVGGAIRRRRALAA